MPASSGKHKPVTFRSDHGVVSVDGNWPQYIKVSLELFGVRPDYLSINSDGHIVLSVSNGTAVYKLDKEQDGFSLCCELVDDNAS